MHKITAQEWDAVLETEEYIESRIKYTQRKIEEGYEIRVPDENELLLDLDSPEALTEFNARLERLKCEIPRLTCQIQPSTTEGHFHAIVTLDFEISNFERIALQAILNSDPLREMLSLFRCWQQDTCPTLLAMPQEKRHGL